MAAQKRPSPAQRTPALTPAATKLRWDKVKEKALRMVFEGRHTQVVIANSCAISPRTLCYWIDSVEFQRRLTKLRDDLAEALKDITYADRGRRVIALDQMAASARAEYEAHPLLREVRPTKDGDVTNEKYNREAFDSFRGALDDIAKELGHRKNIQEVTGKDGGDIKHIIEYVSDWRKT